MSLGKRKKKKKSCSTHLEEYLGTEPTRARQKKSPRPRRQVLEQSAEGLIREKKKKRQKSLSKAARPQACQGGVRHRLGGGTGKKGNMDEACIDQGTQFGQWDTASFENEEQRLKFLKLMGGFKHLSPSFSHPPSMTMRSNMALDKKSSEMLQQNLQQDYDRAMSRMYSHRAGLGFNSEARKDFYIDWNASKSTKLQD